MSVSVYVRIGVHGRPVEIGTIDAMTDMPNLLRSVADEWERQDQQEVADYYASLNDAMRLGYDT